jgi:beta-lactamase regulating signal transducer with metallopeptidase domain
MKFVKNLYPLQSNLAFILVLIGGVIYSAILKNFFRIGMQIWENTQYSPTSQVCRDLGYDVSALAVSNSEIFLLIVGGSLLLSLLLSLIAIILKLIKTNRFVSQLKLTIKNEEFLVFRSDIHQCFTKGFLNQEIYMSDSLFELLSEEQLKCVISHENGHISHYHQLKSILIELILRTLMPFGLHKSVVYKNSVLNEIVADRFAMINGVTEEELLLTMKNLYQINNPDSLSITGFGSQISRVRSITERGHMGGIKYLVQLIIIISFSMVLFFLSNSEISKVEAKTFESNQSVASCYEVLNQEKNQSLPK